MSNLITTGYQGFEETKNVLSLFETVEDKIISIRNVNVIIDTDLANLYGVETRDINKAVKNNLDKFPQGYVFELNNKEKEEVVENFHHLAKLKFSPYLPKAFTERGLYMLATILKSPVATQTTLAIVETFFRLRELSRTVNALPEAANDKEKQKSLLEKSGAIISDLLDNNFRTTDTETSLELNLALLKVKHTVKRKSDN
ncbi:hypothetical protein AGMMS50262_08020 [Bacteroidia bacterium]|nr:hypothetical protein AGMMS50262_08020 [Bacteroidia bacterium]